MTRLVRSLECSFPSWFAPLILVAAGSVFLFSCGSNGSPTVSIPSDPNLDVTLAQPQTLATSIGCSETAHSIGGPASTLSAPLPPGTAAGSIKVLLDTQPAAAEIRLGEARMVPYSQEHDADPQTTYVADLDSQLVDLGGVAEFEVAGLALSTEVCLQIVELIDPVASFGLPEVVANFYQNDPEQITLTDIGLQIAARQNIELAVEDPLSPANLAETANQLLPGESNDVDPLNLNPTLTVDDFDFAEPLGSLTLKDTGVLVANRLLLAFGDPVTSENLLIQANTLLPDTTNDLESVDEILTIPVEPLPDGPNIFVPIGAGYEPDTLDLFVRQAIAYNTDDVVEIRVLLAPFSFSSTEPIDPELNLEDGQERADQVQAACELAVSPPITCNTTLPDVQLRIDAENPDIVAQYDPEVVDGIYGLGGDQEIAMQIVANTPLEAAMQESFERGAPFGGNSAGAAMQSRYMFLAFADDGVIPVTLFTAFTPHGLERDSFLLLYGEDDSVERGLIYGVTNAVIEQHTHQRGRLVRLLQAAQRSPGPKIGLGVDAFTGSLVIENQQVMETIGLTSTVILDQETYGSAAAATYEGPRQILSIRDVAMHLLPEGGYGYDLLTQQPTFNGAPSGSAPDLAGRTFDFLQAPAGAGPLFLGGDQFIPTNPDLLEPIEDTDRLVLSRFAELASATGSPTILLAAGYERNFEANQVLNSLATDLQTLGLTDLQTTILNDTTNLIDLATLLDSAGAIFVTGGDQSFLADQIDILANDLSLPTRWESGVILMLDNAAAAAAGETMVADPNPPVAYLDRSSREAAEAASQPTYLSGEVTFAPGLGLIQDAAFEPRAFFDYRYGRMLSHIFDQDPETVVFGIERETAIEIGETGATVVGPDGVMVFDPRFATLLEIGTNTSFAANYIILDTFTTDQILIPQ